MRKSFGGPSAAGQERPAQQAIGATVAARKPSSAAIQGGLVAGPAHGLEAVQGCRLRAREIRRRAPPRASGASAGPVVASSRQKERCALRTAERWHLQAS